MCVCVCVCVCVCDHVCWELGEGGIVEGACVSWGWVVGGGGSRSTVM